MSRIGRPPTLHEIDGQLMTAEEIAAMLGITNTALYSQIYHYGVSIPALVKMYRENAIGRNHDNAPRYRIDGRWLTQAQIAKELGLKSHTLTTWRSLNKRPDGSRPTLMDAYEHYHQIRTGVRPKYIRTKSGCGRKSTVYMVNGKAWTVKAVAEHFGYSRTTVYHQFRNRGSDMAAVISHFKQLNARKREIEARKIAKAERKILRILKEAMTN